MGPAGAAAAAAALPRRELIVAAAAELFARRGYAAVGMDDIGAASGVSGPAIYRHFRSKAAVLAAVFDRIITDVQDSAAAVPTADPAPALRDAVRAYARGVTANRAVMAVFVREVHHLPPEQADQLRRRQRALVQRWRRLLAAVHPDWSEQRIRTGVHAAFGLLNAVGTFDSPESDDELAGQLAELTLAALSCPSRAG